MKATEDKTFPGAIVAGARLPVGPGGLGRRPDATRTSAPTARCSRATSTRRGPALVRSPATCATARTRRASCSSASSCPTARCRATACANGKLAPDTFGTQLDECAYPILMALAVGLTDNALYSDHIKPAANFVVAHGPVVRRRALGGAERLLAVDDRGRDRRACVAAAEHRRRATATTPRRAVWRGVADDFQRNIKGWTVTTNGPLGAEPYFIRLSKTGDPNAAITYNVGNGGPTLDQRDGHRRRLPRATRGSACCRPTTPTSSRSLAGRRRDDPQRDTASGAGLLPLQRRRLRRRRPTDGQPWAPTEQGHRPPLAGARRRARPSTSSTRGDAARRVARLRRRCATWPPASA